MTLRVIDKDSRIEGGKLVVVIEGDNPEELLSQEAKSMAVRAANLAGYSRVGINNTSGPYPVDQDGKMPEDWNKLAAAGGIVAYRNEISLLGGL